jgi:threonine dehydrogenase-like Zn-dependent dehydrogenase
MYGKNDVKVETFELPEIKEDEILAKVVSNSICMSTYKAVTQGKDHKRVPSNVDTHPIITGHEFAGEIVKVGQKWQDEFKPGDQYAIQPALNYKGSPFSPGYSYEYFGGNATYIVIPHEVMELGCLLKYEGEGYFDASLAEPMSCIIGAFHANYHTRFAEYVHDMDIKAGGNMALLAAAGPMGLGAIDYAINRERKPKNLIVTDIDNERLDRAKKILPPEKAKAQGVNLVYMNPMAEENFVEAAQAIVGDEGYDDVFVFAPVKPVIEQADQLLGKDGCLNFFAGPIDKSFSAQLNFYNVHYMSTHIVGTSGGSTDDMRESLEMSSKGTINPAVMITHIGGLEAAKEANLTLPDLGGGKKLIYPAIDWPLTAIESIVEMKDKNEYYQRLGEIIEENDGLWSAKAEAYLLNHKDQF